MRRSITEGFFSIFGARVVRTVLAVVSLPLIVRGLGPAGYGDYGFLISAFSLWMILVSAGVTEGTQKFLAEDRREGWSAAVLGYYVRVAGGLALLGALVVLALSVSGVAARLLGERFTLYVALLAAFVVTAQFRSLSRRALMAMGLERYSEPLQVASKLAYLGVGLGLIWLGYGVAGLLVGNVVSSAVVAAVGLWLVFRRVPLPSVLAAPPDSFPRRELLSFNALNVVLVLLTMSLYHVDVVMVQVLAGSERTGYYKAALMVAEYLWFVPTSLQVVLLHSTAELWSRDDHERLASIATRVTRYTLLLTALMAVGLAALADRFVPLYFGTDFRPVVAPLLWLLPGTVGFALARPLLSISRASGDLRPLLAATGGAAALNVALNAVLIPRAGIAGAAVATSLGYGSMVAFHVAAARHLGYDPLADLRGARVAATVLATAAVVFAASRAVPGDFAALVVVPPLGLGVHVGVALATGAVDRGELAQLVDSVPLANPVGG